MTLTGAPLRKVHRHSVLQVESHLCDPLWAGPAGRAAGDGSHQEALCYAIEFELALRRTQFPVEERQARKLRERAERLESLFASAVLKLRIYASPSDFVAKTEVETLCPRVAAHLEGQPLPQGRMPSQLYFTHTAMLNQMLAVSAQIRNDLTTLDNHKYIAHMLAMLYQCITQAGPHMKRFKEEIEAKFSTVKAATKAHHETARPTLGRELRNWLIGLTKDVDKSVQEMPPSFTKPLVPVVQYLTSSS